MKYFGKITSDKDLVTKEYVEDHFCGQVETLPTASADYNGKIYQYTGATTSSAPIYTNGAFYKCVNDSGTYKWAFIPGDYVLRVTSMPPSSDYDGYAVMYDGETAGDYKKGLIYRNLKATYYEVEWGNLGVSANTHYAKTDPQDSFTDPVKLYTDVYCTIESAYWGMGIAVYTDSSATEMAGAIYSCTQGTAPDKWVEAEWSSYLRRFSSMPPSSEYNAYTVLYDGETTSEYTRGGLYHYVAGTTTYKCNCTISGTEMDKYSVTSPEMLLSTQLLYNDQPCTESCGLYVNGFGVYYDEEGLTSCGDLNSITPVTSTGSWQKTGGSSIVVIDNLTSTSSGDALSARQGSVLSGMIGTLSSLATTAKDCLVSAVNELKSKLSDYLPLAGGTMTGTLYSSKNPSMARGSDDSLLSVYGGTNSGGGVLLYGPSHSDAPGYFRIKADNESYNTVLEGTPEGSLKWGGNAVAVGSFLPLAGGTMTGTITSGAGTFMNGLSEGYTRFICGGVSGTTSASLQIQGGEKGGRFYLKACDGTDSCYMEGEPSGGLTWNGVDISGGLTDYSSAITMQSSTSATNLKLLGVGKMRIIFFDGVSSSSTASGGLTLATISSAHKSALTSGQYCVCSNTDRTLFVVGIDAQTKINVYNYQTASKKFFGQLVYFVA